jgi:hypothetical protein
MRGRTQAFAYETFSISLSLYFRASKIDDEIRILTGSNVKFILISSDEILMFAPVFVGCLPLGNSSKINGTTLARALHEQHLITENFIFMPPLFPFADELIDDQQRDAQEPSTTGRGRAVYGAHQGYRK